MLNLAAFRYRDILAGDGGPVARLTCGEVCVCGARWFQANAHLRPGLGGEAIDKHIFSGADGSGTASSPLVARCKAVSEALERWAHAARHASPERARWGFDVDPSSNGMAAFPGLFARQARRAAWFEAVERFNLLHWWEGRLAAHERPSPWPDVSALVIASDLPGVTVVLQRVAADGWAAYGHAAAADFPAACHKAVVELERHAFALRHFLPVGAVPGGGVQAGASHLHPIEQRCHFFAGTEGQALFRERVRAGLTGPRARPRLVFDGVVPGPWERYAHVWRVVFEPPSRRFFSRATDYFLW